jgi:hypothetical protein
MRGPSKGAGGPTIPDPKIKTGSWLDEEGDEEKPSSSHNLAKKFQYDLPGIHFGTGTDEGNDDMPDIDDTDDDELQAKTDPDTIALLGFDPLELEDDDDDEVDV